MRDDSCYFTVIIPVYQDNTRLFDCLHALISQDFPIGDFEVIVINNDPLNFIYLESYFYKKLTLRLYNELKPGSYAARNKGIRMSNGKILAFTDSDCVPDRNWLKSGKKYFEMDKIKELGILAGAVPLFYKSTNELSTAEIYEKYTGFTQDQYAKKGNCITANWFSYRFVIEEFGGFDSNLKSNGDTELSGRISKKYCVLYAPDVIVRHPARYHVREISFKYRRLLGGTYSRRFVNQPFSFFGHLINFTFRRLKFLLKKILTIHPLESFALAYITWHIIVGSWREYFILIKGGDAKR